MTTYWRNKKNYPRIIAKYSTLTTLGTHWNHWGEAIPVTVCKMHQNTSHGYAIELPLETILMSICKKIYFGSKIRKVLFLLFSFSGALLTFGLYICIYCKLWHKQNRNFHLFLIIYFKNLHPFVENWTDMLVIFDRVCIVPDKGLFFFRPENICIFLISPYKDMLWVLIRNTLLEHL